VRINYKTIQKAFEKSLIWTKEKLKNVIERWVCRASGIKLGEKREYKRSMAIVVSFNQSLLNPHFVSNELIYD